MKVMQINAVYNVGSTGVIVDNLHHASIAQGIDSHVAYSTSRLKREDIVNGYSAGKTFGKKVHALLSRINGKQGYFSRCSTKKLIKHIENVSPDIVHLHNLHSNYLHLNMLLRYLAKKEISVVITLHDCWFFSGGCFYYTAENCDKWQRSCGKCPKKHMDTPAYFFDKSSRILADRKKYLGAIKSLYVVGVSEWITNEARKTFLSGKDTCTIYNGIDVDVFSPIDSDLKKKYGLEGKFVVLGPASKWLKPVNKETLEYFANNLPDDCVLVLFGCTSSQKELLPDGVVAIDFINSREELRKVYSMADVFANCTREDALSLINIEVQACGTPAITYANTGVQETVDNKCGFTVPSGDHKAFLDAVLDVKKAGKNAYSEACRNWVVEKFDSKKNYNEYIELYRSVSKSEE